MIKERENNIILDCDTGEDDALAILVALQELLPLHYVISSHGNSSIENTTRNASRLLSYVGYSGVTVIRGSSHSLEPHLIELGGESAGDFVGKNGLCNVELPETEVPNIISPDEQDFPEFLAQIIKSEAPVDYIVTGPSTNLARACMHLGPSIKDYIGNVYMMGGALYEQGNSGREDPQTAEFNFYCDPNAVNVVLESGLPVHLVTWDMTSQLTVPHDRIDTFHGRNIVSQFSIGLMKNFFTYYGLSHDRNFELNDPITVMARLGYGSYREERIRVVTEVKDYGRSVLDSNGISVNYFNLTQPQGVEIVDAVLRTLEVI